MRLEHVLVEIRQEHSVKDSSTYVRVRWRLPAHTFQRKMAYQRARTCAGLELYLHIPIGACVFDENHA